MYMSSQCANDGSYNLMVTFKHGVDLNMAQVLVQNRVSLAVPSLPDVIKQTGVTTIKRSPDILCGIALMSPTGRYDQLYLSNYAVLQVKDELARVDGVGDIFLFGQRDYSMRIWLDPHKLASRGLNSSDVVAAIREQNAPVATGSIGQQPSLPGQETQITLSTLGRLSTPEAVRRHHPQGDPRRRADADQGRRPRGLGGQEPGRERPPRRARRDLPRHLPDARRQRPRHARTRDRQDGRAEEELPRGAHLRHRFRHDSLHAGVDPRGAKDAARRDYPRGDRRAVVPAELAVVDHSARRRPGGHRRHVRRDAALRVQFEQPDALRPGACHRDCRRRRNCRRRSGRASHRSRGCRPAMRRCSRWSRSPDR